MLHTLIPHEAKNSPWKSTITVEIQCQWYKVEYWTVMYHATNNSNV